MNAAILGVLVFCVFVLAYRYYGRFLTDRIFSLKDENPQDIPSKKFKDNIDFVPTDKHILFGHHFSSIAGAAPIVGPCVAVIWGWVPAVAWIVLGVIFMGAAHDLGALILSLKHRGGSVGEVARSLLGERARALFLVVIFFLIWMVIAVFTLVIANLFMSFPSSVLPVNFEIFVALAMGFFLNRKGKGLKGASLIAQCLLYVMIFLGLYFPLSLSPLFGEYELYVWMVFLMGYSFIASVLPVWALIQPRDLINSHQLIMGLGLMILGIFVTQPEIVAPAFNADPVGAPSWFPFLFITIACGAVSGFHGLVSGGTSSKQVSHWKDAKLIGYGSMLGEGTLALLATLAVASGFDSQAQWHDHYRNWELANGLSAKISVFIMGAGKFISGLGFSESMSQNIVAVLIISFAATSLDTACRIQRYIIGEFGEMAGVPLWKNRYLGSALAVLSALLLMLLSSGGKGGLLLWPLFGASNQMLAGLTLIIITVFLAKRRRNYWPFLLPAIFILLITSASLSLNTKHYYDSGQWHLFFLGLLLFCVQLWIIGEGIFSLRAEKKMVKT
jgi:carbon starvation protein